MTKYKASPKEYFTYALALAVAVGTLLFFGGSFLRTRPSYDIREMEEGWTLTYPDGRSRQVSLKDAELGLTHAGDVFVLTHLLPEEEVPAADVECSTILYAIDVYVDDVPVYSFGHDRGQEGEIIPIRLHNIPLPQGYGGRELKMVLTMYYDDAISGLSLVRIGSRSDLFITRIQEMRLALIVGSFLMVFALVLIVISSYLVVYQRGAGRIFASVAVLFLLGFYILCYSEQIDLFTSRPSLRTMMEYASLYMMPAAFIAFIGTIFEGRHRKILLIVAAVDACLALGVYALQYLDILMIHRAVPFFLIVTVVEGAAAVGYLIYRVVIRRRHTGKRESDISLRTSEQILLGGVAYLVLSALIDIIRYMYYRFFTTQGTDSAGITALTQGSLVFSACLLINYFFYSIDFMNARIVHQKMEGLAYTDSLTNLANRTRCEEVLVRLTGSPKPYAVISMDVNNLKQVNDTLGHAAGDRFIASFAALLIECFGADAYLIGRMGGDEFIIVFEDKSEAMIGRLIEQMQRLMERESARSGELQYDAAWGIAYSSELEGASSNDVYMLADNRMYADKEAKKQGRAYG